MSYEYLTFSAGGIIMIPQIACLQCLIKNKIIDYEKIKSPLLLFCRLFIRINIFIKY